MTNTRIPPTQARHASLAGNQTRPPASASPATVSISLPAGATAPSQHRIIQDGDGKSPHPPAHQLLRHVRALRSGEINLMGSVPANSPEHRIFKKNVEYFKGYEKHLEALRGPTLKREQREIDARHRAAKAEAAVFKAGHKRMDREIDRARNSLTRLEGRKAAIEHQQKVLGARSKGDEAPVKFTDRVTRNGVHQEASLDKGSTGKGILGFFRRSERLDRLTPEELQNRLWRVKGEMAQVTLDLKHFESEKARIGWPADDSPRYEIVSLPSREEILKAMHESQPLRRRPWKDALPAAPVEAASDAGPALKPALRTGGPRADAPAKQVRFADEAGNEAAPAAGAKANPPKAANPREGWRPMHWDHEQEEAIMRRRRSDT